VKVPPLGERLDELAAWADFMLARRHAESGAEGTARIAPDALKLLCDSTWPGNLRQLDNIVRRAYAFTLLENRGPRVDRVLHGRDVDRAFAAEDGPKTTSLLDQIRRAAAAFVREAERRENNGAPLALDLADAFRGFVLKAAVDRLGDRDDAFRLLGHGNLVKSRNHHKVLKRELERVRELLVVLGEDPDPALSELEDL
jgi:DNA-binding NtrC family response regulator